MLVAARIRMRCDPYRLRCAHDASASRRHDRDAVDSSDFRGICAVGAHRARRARMRVRAFELNESFSRREIREGSRYAWRSHSCDADTNVDATRRNERNATQRNATNAQRIRAAMLNDSFMPALLLHTHACKHERTASPHSRTNDARCKPLRQRSVSIDK
ncbi:hypothetical protein GLE_0839 [Lysobacter enzymogenes]|uniref:Uncharacterized protein n=1 Tax=Lysobacter enzymogenes TaxID=69 RepID=A0A0S2DCE4_LYSEN|nr:hypothetical protein GLE_0839 [Lysobacter enzymogenes]